MRFYYLAAAVQAAILVSACAEDPVYKASPFASLEISKIETKSQESSPSQTQQSPNVTKNQKQAANLKRYATYLRGLSDREKVEWLTLNEKRQGYYDEDRKIRAEWSKSNPALRGTRPTIVKTPEREKTFARMSELELKIKKANVPNKYKTLDRNILTQSEIDELISLEIENLDFQFQKQKEYQRRLKLYSKQQADEYLRTASNGQRSNRLEVLQGKMRSAQHAKNSIARIEHESKTYNINLPQSDMDQLKALEVEKYILREETKRLRRVQADQRKNQRTHNGFHVFNTADYYEKIKNNQTRISEIDARIRAFRTPLDVAILANRTRASITQLSKKYEIFILSSEIEELVDLTAEQQSLQRKLYNYNRAYNKPSGYESFSSPPSPSEKEAHYTRLREINTRIQEIRAPLNEAQRAERAAKLYSRY